MTHLLAVAALLLASCCWGATFVLVKDSLQWMPPEYLMSSRFLLAGVLLLLIAGLRRTLTLAAVGPGLVLGLLLGTGFWLQIRGLAAIAPSRSALLTGFSIVFVPFFDRAIYKVPLRLNAVAATVLALLGLYFLAGGVSGGLAFGDLLTLAGATLFAIHIVFSARVSRLHSELSLAAIQITAVGVGTAPALLLQKPANYGLHVVGSIVVMALIPTALAFFLLMWSQARLTATEAAVILAFEPISAAVTSLLLKLERWTIQQHLIGGGLIVTAMILTQVKRYENSQQAA